jgi:aryl-alcohol dehydrogenase-like predicted oxidoreductase
MSDTASTRPTLGGTYPLAGRPVARVGYGAMQLDRLEMDAAASVLQHALETGVNHLDTADFYGAGFVNEVIRRVVGSRDDVFVATKIGAVTNEGGPLPLRPAQKPDELRASIENNLRTLSRDRLDLVYLRRLDAGPGMRAEGDQDVPLEDQLAPLLALRDAGDIGAIGLSGITIDVLQEALPAGIVAVQNAYSVVDREFEQMMQLTVAEQVAWIPYFPLGSAFPGYPKVTEQQAVIDAAGRLDATPSQVGLAWLLQRTPNTLLIPGTSSSEHLDENNAAGDVVLDAETVAALDALVPTGVGEIQWTSDQD